jgi:hypothetical protein
MNGWTFNSPQPLVGKSSENRIAMNARFLLRKLGYSIILALPKKAGTDKSDCGG